MAGSKLVDMKGAGTSLVVLLILIEAESEPSELIPLICGFFNVEAGGDDGRLRGLLVTRLEVYDSY
jgi:hypothetical protein